MVDRIAALFDVIGALENWVKAYEGMLACSDSFHMSITRTEAKALADLLAAADRPDLAGRLIETWFEVDDETDADDAMLASSYIVDYNKGTLS